MLDLFLMGLTHMPIKLAYCWKDHTTIITSSMNLLVHIFISFTFKLSLANLTKSMHFQNVPLKSLLAT